MTVQDLKVGDEFLVDGITTSGKQVKTKAKLISYNGMNDYVIENGGIRILIEGDTKVYQLK